MGKKCSVVGCFTNYAGYDRGTVFSLPQDEEQRMKWIKFLNREDASSLKKIQICYKHFADNVMEKTPTRIKLSSTLKPVPTLIPNSQEVINLPPVPF